MLVKIAAASRLSKKYGLSVTGFINAKNELTAAEASDDETPQ
jgi:hypothetical protein